MKNKSVLLLLFYSILILGLSSCERKLTGWGDDGDIYVLADSAMWKNLEPALKQTFEKEIITPQTEYIFNIRRAELNQFKRFKNLIFLATLDCDSSVSRLVKSNLSPAARQKVEAGEAYVFTKNNKWAEDQLIMFLVAPDTIALKQKILENSKHLFNIYNDYWNDAQNSHLYFHGEQEDMQQHLLESYNWTLRIPNDYEIFIESPDSNFIMLRRMLPERWLFVNWIEPDDPAIVTEKWCYSHRDSLSKIFYGNDFIEQKFVQPEYEEVDFLGRRAAYIKGLWRNDEKMAGGPFRSYTFYDEKSNLIYMLDYAIFSPRLKKFKRHYLRQAEIILHTFKTKQDLLQKN